LVMVSVTYCAPHCVHNSFKACVRWLKEKVLNTQAKFFDFLRKYDCVPQIQPSMVIKKCKNQIQYIIAVPKKS
jgi:hypothetical protein